MEARYGLFGDSANLDARQEHGLHGTQAKKLFWTHAMVLLGEEAHVESWFNLFGDSVRLGAQFAWYIPYAQKSI